MLRLSTLSICCLVLAAGCERGMDPNAPGDFSMTDLDGKTVKLSELHGKVVLLSFWFLGCPPCRAEAPYLSRLAETYRKEGLVVLAVNVANDPPEEIRRFRDAQKLQQTFVPGGHDVAEAFGASRFPTTVYLDRQGRRVRTDLGFTPSHFPKMEARVKELLSGKAEG